MDDCIFCKIAAHEIPSTVAYEDDLVVASDDLNPQAPVHTLVIPKQHYANIVDGVTDGFRVIANTGAAAGQTVMHFHMHVLGGTDLGENLL